MSGRVLTVSALDSHGEAGIQADIKTVTALGGYATSAVTGLLVQGASDIPEIFEVPAAFVGAQMSAALDDAGADCIKTGFLPSAATIDIVSSVIGDKAENLPLVVDPAMIATGGRDLISQADAQSLKARLILNATILTPNIPEAIALTGLDIVDVEAMKHAAEMLVTLGPKAVLIKGGNLDGRTISDVLFDDDGIDVLESPRSDIGNSHGIGCTLASAIATGLAQGLAVRDAVMRARAYVDEAIRTAGEYPDGSGRVNHGHTVGTFP